MPSVSVGSPTGGGSGSTGAGGKQDGGRAELSSWAGAPVQLPPPPLGAWGLRNPGQQVGGLQGGSPGPGGARGVCKTRAGTPAGGAQRPPETGARGRGRGEVGHVLLGPGVLSSSRGAGPPCYLEPHPVHLRPQPQTPPTRGAPALHRWPRMALLWGCLWMAPQGPLGPAPCCAAGVPEKLLGRHRPTSGVPLSPEVSPRGVGGVLGASVSREEGSQGYLFPGRGLALFARPTVHLGGPSWGQMPGSGARSSDCPLRWGGVVLTPTPG